MQAETVLQKPNASKDPDTVPCGFRFALCHQPSVHVMQSRIDYKANIFSSDANLIRHWMEISVTKENSNAI